MSLSYCPECPAKQQRINELEEENAAPRARLRHQERAAAEGPFGSQSDRGAATCETLMTVLHALRKRTADPAAAFKAALDQLAQIPRRRPLHTPLPPNTP